MIKLVVSDIDGTLVPDGSNQIDPDIYTVIRELKDRGIRFVAASGRQYESIRRLMAPVADDILFVAENGGKVMFRDKFVSVDYMGTELAKELILFLRDLPECEIMLATPDYTWLETKDEAFADWMINGYKFKLRRTENLLPLCSDTIKIAAYRRKGIQDILKKIRGRFEGRMNITVSGEMWVDCMS
ncbi:MAG: Cof-type HAD-IIB family hydrolase, partial [Lachnospiraceae bacterium]|nr:Cof-type HAD-IIB family hydrolase [Lachnospiraceae bacterium]